MQSTGLELYLYLIPILFFIMGLEIYSIQKSSITINKYEYTVNVISAFAMGLFDIIVTVHIFKAFHYISTFSILNLDNSLLTHLIALFVTDFVFYCSHYCGHKFPVFWAIHGVHHQPEQYNLSVGLRQPWFHKIYSTFFYLLIAFIGVPLDVLQTVYAVIVISQFWTHTEFIRSEIPYISKILMTPSQHRVHHGQNEKYIDRNFGLTFSLWDQLFKTHTPETEKVIFGTNEKFEKSNALWANIYPLILVCKKIRVAYRENILLQFLIGLKNVSIPSADPYGSLKNDLSNSYIYSFQYYLLNNFLLTGITFTILISPLIFIKKLLSMIVIMFAFGVIGLLGDKKILGSILLIPTILVLSILLFWINPVVAMVFLVTQVLYLVLKYIGYSHLYKRVSLILR